MPETACHGTQLHALLAEPGMAALLAAAPEAARILRPLCRMLGVEKVPGLAMEWAVPAAPAVRRTRPSAVALICAAPPLPPPACVPGGSAVADRPPPWPGWR